MSVLNLKDLREQAQTAGRDTPFRHQAEAIQALAKTLPCPITKPKSGLLVLPTGAGKTFTAVKYLCDEALPRHIKILWLAHSFHLLDQAVAAFHRYAPWIPSRDTVSVRVVSGSPTHEKAFSIETNDDVIVMTTQTAIRNLHSTAEDAAGQRVRTKFRQFLEACAASGLVIVLDEAHHAPAFGCRHLLIGSQEPRIGIRRLVENSHLLGLTATPTYTDKSRRGWLREIFGEQPIYAADKTSLIAEGILARPKFIERETGREFKVPDAIYNRIVREHTDLPEEIVEKLAADAARNDFIVNEYVVNREKYGKTIIFADRWFQCRYLMSKLRERGVRADVVYSHIDADPGSIEARNQRTESDNSRVIETFKYGKDAQGRDLLDVLVNVRMLTEGTDVPTVKTVFVTRQTTSSILLTQMIGRALRGKRAGGHDEANVVLFVDDWKRLIDWATVIPRGELGETILTRGYRPLEFISERLIDELSKDIVVDGDFAPAAFVSRLPVGWFQVELTISTAEENFDETQAFVEFVMVYEHTKDKFQRFMDRVPENLSEEWSNEFLRQEWMLPQVEIWISDWFDHDADDIGNTLRDDLIRIVRHIAQNGAMPTFHSFEDRRQYDLDVLAAEAINKTPLEHEAMLQSVFAKPGSLWKTFYKAYGNFRRAFSLAIERVLIGTREGTLPPSPTTTKPRPKKRHLNPEEREQVFRRDDYTCLACGKKGKRGRGFQPDHIIPFELGGDTTVDNAQTLCSACNNQKAINEINFRNNITSLTSPKALQLPTRSRDEDPVRSLTRLVNFFYRCRAVSQVHLHQRNTGKHFARWKIELYAGNNPAWLLQHKPLLVEHIHHDLGYSHVEDVEITAPDWAPPASSKIRTDERK